VGISRYDPTAQDALVMPEPSKRHQAKYNKTYSIPILSLPLFGINQCVSETSLWYPSSLIHSCRSIFVHISVKVSTYLILYDARFTFPGVQFMYESVMGMRKHEGNGCILADEMYVSTYLLERRFSSALS
jgi:DNA repair and recombination protein RAD54B